MIDSFPLRRGPLPAGVGILHGWRVTSYFGGRIDPLTGRPGRHGGMDLAYWGCTGEPILAPCSGVVAQGWDPSGGGNWTGLAGDDGCYWGMGHAQRFESGMNRRHVKAGTVLAYVGTSGGSTGAHLHLAYRPPRAGAYADPYDLLTAVDPDGPMLVTVGADPLYAIKDWFDMATEEQLRTIVRQECQQVVESLVNVQGNLAGVTKGEGAETRSAGHDEGLTTRKLITDLDQGNLVELEQVADNLAGVTRGEGNVTRTEMQTSLAGAMANLQASGGFPADIDVNALATKVAAELTVTPKAAGG